MGNTGKRWVCVEEGLHEKLSLMLELELKHIKFIVQSEEHTGETSFTDQQNEPNVFNRMMERARQTLLSYVKESGYSI